MSVLQICVGGPRTLEWRGRPVETCIFKSPVGGAVMATSAGLAGDRQSDLTVHGGRDKAIYVYSDDYSAGWARELDVPHLQPSQFGQNLLVEGFPDTGVVIGSSIRIGDALATVTQPRIPCYKLGIRLGDDTFPDRFWRTGRLGFYLRVDRDGAIAVGDSLDLLTVPAHGITVRALYRAVLGGSRKDARDMLDALQDLDAGWRRRLTVRAA